MAQPAIFLAQPAVRLGPAGCKTGPAGCKTGPAGCQTGPAGCQTGPAGCKTGPADCRTGPAGCKTGPASCKGIKSYGVDGLAGYMVVAHGPCDFSVSPSPFVLTLGLWTRTSDLGLTILVINVLFYLIHTYTIPDYPCCPPDKLFRDHNHTSTCSIACIWLPKN